MPDIYDAAKYDSIHHAHLGLSHMHQVYEVRQPCRKVLCVLGREQSFDWVLLVLVELTSRRTLHLTLP